jgi:hypothetical protein
VNIVAGERIIQAAVNPRRIDFLCGIDRVRRTIYIE